ncbi:MAG: hypothetical protein M1816_007182 [Peltula sp. TS41687]|nr:MAG: hypothetical protein M1816_007182 [Peltula sp. TS41687]
MPTIPPLNPQHQAPPPSPAPAPVPPDPTSPKTTYNILITGFGPFDPRAPINPSSAVLPYLPSRLTFIVDDNDEDKDDDPVPTKPTAIDISIQTHPHIRVSYDVVAALIPQLYNAHDEFDFVVHIGMMSGSAGGITTTTTTTTTTARSRHEYHLETCARSGKYTARDVDGKLPGSAPAIAGNGNGRSGTDEVQVLSPKGVDFSDVLLRWRRETSVEEVLGDIVLRPSNDAGLFLCEYIYYTSLRYFARRASEDKEGDAVTKVVFLHVPADAQMDDLQRAKEVVVGLVRALVGSSLTARHEVEPKEL